MCVPAGCTPDGVPCLVRLFPSWSGAGTRGSDAASWGHSEAGPPRPVRPAGVPSTRFCSWSSQPRTVGEAGPGVWTGPFSDSWNWVAPEPP